MRDDDAGGGGEQTMAETTDTLFANVFFPIQSEVAFQKKPRFFTKGVVFSVFVPLQNARICTPVFEQTLTFNMACIQTLSLCVFVNGVVQCRCQQLLTSRSINPMPLASHSKVISSQGDNKQISTCATVQKNSLILGDKLIPPFNIGNPYIEWLYDKKKKLQKLG